ncbi:MAG: hypothetical protein AB7Q00_12655 [Phycisphaerales bacterium]
MVAALDDGEGKTLPNLSEFSPFADSVYSQFQSAIHEAGDSRRELRAIRDANVVLLAEPVKHSGDRLFSDLKGLRLSISKLLQEAIRRYQLGDPNEPAPERVVSDAPRKGGQVRLSMVVVAGEEAAAEQAHQALALGRFTASQTERKGARRGLVLGVGLRKAFLDALESAVSSLPNDYENRRNALVEIHDLVRERLAKSLEPALNAEAANRAHSTYEEKKDLAKWINAELRRMGLAIKDPKMNIPVLLVGNTGANPAKGRFVLDRRTDDGKRIQSTASVELPRLELMPDDLQRVQQGQGSGRRR